MPIENHFIYFGVAPGFASIREPEEVIAEELEQLAITEEESITMPDTAAEINEATAASVTRADMDMAVFCHKVDEQRIVCGMWSEVHLLHRLRFIFEQEALPTETRRNWRWRGESDSSWRTFQHPPTYGHSGQSERHRPIAHARSHRFKRCHGAGDSRLSEMPSNPV